MMFMVLFWFLIIVIATLAIIRDTYPKSRAAILGIIGYLAFLQMILFLLAVATKDPLLPASWGIDPFWELVSEGIVASFTVWGSYLNPLKEKVYSMDREIGETKKEVSFVVEKVNKIEADAIRFNENLLKIMETISRRS